MLPVSPCDDTAGYCSLTCVALQPEFLNVCFWYVPVARLLYHCRHSAGDMQYCFWYVPAKLRALPHERRRDQQLDEVGGQYFIHNIFTNFNTHPHSGHKLYAIICRNDDDGDDDNNKDQSNLAIGGIASLHSPVATWQQQFAVACFGVAIRPSNLPFPGGSVTPSNTKCHWIPHMHLPHGI